MTQNEMSLKERLAQIASRRCKFEPKVRSFKEFTTMAAICAELTKQLDNDPGNSDKHSELEPYCGAPLANVMISLCWQLATFKLKQNPSSEEALVLCEILNEYLTGAEPFVRLAAAYGLSAELKCFMQMYPDPANIEISDEALDELPKEEPEEPYDIINDDTDESCFLYEDVGEDEDDIYDDVYYESEEERWWETGNWYDEPNAWMFSDEKSFREYQRRQYERDAEYYAQKEEEDADLSDETEDEENEHVSQYRVLCHLSPEQIRFVKPFAKEYFLAKAIEYCSKSTNELFNQGIFDFPDQDFSPETRRKVEENSNESFVKLYGMTASEESLKTGIEYVNSALKKFEEMYVRRAAEGE